MKSRSVAARQSPDLAPHAPVAGGHRAPALRAPAPLLTDDSDRKRYRLAERLADLFDQYQVYRADWLGWDWATGHHVLNTARGERKPLAAGNRWQAELWRILLEDVGEEGMARAAPVCTSAHRM
jgi:exonuclease V gamma subunit